VVGINPEPTDLRVLASGSLSLPGSGHSDNANQLLTPTDRMANLLSGVVSAPHAGQWRAAVAAGLLPLRVRCATARAFHATLDRSKMVSVSQLAQPWVTMRSIS